MMNTRSNLHTLSPASIAQGLMWYGVMTKSEIAVRTGLDYGRVRRMAPSDSGLTVDELLHMSDMLDHCNRNGT